jgi:hypothetical protein
MYPVGGSLNWAGVVDATKQSERHKLLLTETPQIKLGFKENPTPSSFENTLNPKTQH